MFNPPLIPVESLALDLLCAHMTASPEVVELFPAEVRAAGMGLSYNVPGCVYLRRNIL